MIHIINVWVGASLVVSLLFAIPLSLLVIVSGILKLIEVFDKE